MDYQKMLLSLKAPLDTTKVNKDNAFAIGLVEANELAKKGISVPSILKNSLYSSPTKPQQTSIVSVTSQGLLNQKRLTDFEINGKPIVSKLKISSKLHKSYASTIKEDIKVTQQKLEVLNKASKSEDTNGKTGNLDLLALKNKIIQANRIDTGAGINTKRVLRDDKELKNRHRDMLNTNASDRSQKILKKPQPRESLWEDIAETHGLCLNLNEPIKVESAISDILIGSTNKVSMLSTLDYKSSNNQDEYNIKEANKWDFYNCSEYEFYFNLLNPSFYTCQNFISPASLLPNKYTSYKEYMGRWIICFFHELKSYLMNSKVDPREYNRFEKDDLTMSLTFHKTICKGLNSYEITFNKAMPKQNMSIFKENDLIFLSTLKQYGDNKDLIKLGDTDAIIAIIKSYKHNANAPINYCLYIQESVAIKEQVPYYCYYYQNVISFYREFSSLVNFSKLPQNYISYLREPPSHTPSSNNKESINSIKGISEFNDSQLSAIEKSINLKSESFLLIQGPPGTGKTHTIIGILSAIFQRKKQSKIMICTPSNSAIDEIMIRVVDKGLIDSYGMRFDPKLIRVGCNEKQRVKSDAQYCISAKLKKCVLEEIIEEELKNNNNPVAFKEKINRLSQSIGENEKEPKDEKERQQQAREKLKIKDQIKDLKLIQQSLGGSASSCKKQLRSYLVKSADIVFTTLNSSGSESLKVFNHRYDYLIIDEACQSTEPSSLIPLQLGIDKIIMVGDHKQLPATIFNESLSSFKYNRSMFERLIDNNHPRHILNTQYRMHKSIADLISITFYEGKLESSTKKSSYDIFDSKYAFTFFKVEKSKEEYEGSSCINHKEAKTILKFLTYFDKRLVDTRTQPPTIGVISPYKEQVSLLSREISNLSSLSKEFKNNLKIQTVDSFQGKEEDVILLSTVRTKSLGFLIDFRRLNVAISRAKQACIIFGDTDLLLSNEYWKKIIDYCQSQDSLINLKDDSNTAFRTILKI